jgi:hypothetical protein
LARASPVAPSRSVTINARNRCGSRET